ncbi:DUF445 domain-containing protein [Halalkalibaculum sp. DA3122]|uniref:DUF445 domain-containing protein n=1 Tax=Halalkalibaculum sp. DA3122 TaxID=3373607 RepID=UPI0037541A48
MSEQPPVTEPGNQSAFEVAKSKTKTYARNLWDIVSRYAVVELPKETAAKPEVPPARFEYRHKGWLALLGFFPYLLASMFVTSFFWDFQNLQLSPMGLQLQLEGLLRILSISGLIGFFTNWLAITMLFKPSQKRPILGYGLIPAQKERIAWRLSRAVSDDLINPEIIKQKIHESQLISRYREEATAYLKSIIDDPSFREELKTWVVEYVDEMIADQEIRSAIAEKILLQIEEAVENKSIEKVALKAYSFIRGQEMQKIIEEALIRLPGSVERGLDKVDDLLDRLPSSLEKHSDAIENIVTSLLYHLVNQLDVQALVEEKLNEYDEQKLTNIIRGATNEQLKYIQYLGAVLGTIGGFVIWEPLLSITVLGIVGGLILMADHLIFQFRNS